MTYFNKPLVLVGALLALVAAGANAQVDAKVAETIKARLSASNPQATYGEVRQSPIPGLYEVEVSGSTLFVSADGSHFVYGDLYRVDNAGVVNLSEENRAKQRARVMEEQDIDDMIVFSPEKGETKAHIFVFTDVECGYCRKLHNDVPELNKLGIEVRYLAFPRAGLDSLGYRKLATAWCAKDPNGTLTALKNRENVPLEVCDDNPVAAQYKLGGEAIKVRGTPTIVLEDGTLIPGYQPPELLSKGLGI
ncbi:DsbC family protein [Microbulbifer sp. 2201CG32-9]|uniref:DsbC family protein n=1 Tax=unclassified Microbulbifer TaxID=2619833 RepID=UPI00345BF609